MAYKQEPCNRSNFSTTDNISFVARDAQSLIEKRVKSLNATMGQDQTRRRE